jgi:hypothetical protein
MQCHGAAVRYGTNERTSRVHCPLHWAVPMGSVTKLISEFILKLRPPHHAAPWWSGMKLLSEGSELNFTSCSAAAARYKTDKRPHFE